MYVDKTELVYRLVNINKTYFLSRPRRFSKSLLVSTLEAYFQRKKELFEELAMERLEKEWNVYPVLHIDFSMTKYTEFTDLTGISKFSQMSIFSELNNLQNISMSDDYSAICSITERKLHTQLKGDCRSR